MSKNKDSNVFHMKFISLKYELVPMYIYASQSALRVLKSELLSLEYQEILGYFSNKFTDINKIALQCTQQESSEEHIT